ncbi:hypothetical protein VL15_07215 [Burkholderia cepacia]|uniref:Uncharacterized protein n=1 Tax=Burkholderia cepacia TaxID=292 RepID=A0A0J5XAF4_BURCE|nr:hypothetical protein [Burkholderia cepacia]KML60893.1 hypothetical protein VL15_07215 [Burkholderia cepacia]
MQTVAQKILVNPNPATGQQAGYQAAMAGRTLYVQSSDAGNVLTITLTDVFGNRETVQSVGAGAKLTPAAGFVAVTISTTADSNVAFIVTQGDIDIQLNQTTVNIGNGSGNPVPVAIVSEPGSPFPVTVTGTVAVSGATLTATNVGINNTTANPVPVQLHVSDITVPVLPALALTPATVTPVVVAAGATGAVLLAADATRRAVRFFNPASSAGPVAIVPAAADAYANGAIVLNPGDFWNETDAPGAAWYASTPAATGATVNLQTVKA